MEIRTATKSKNDAILHQAIDFKITCVFNQSLGEEWHRFCFLLLFLFPSRLLMHN
jgi:hypothetical protein